MNTMGEGENEMNWESSMETYTLPYVKCTVSGNLQFTEGAQSSALWQPREAGWGGRWEGGSRERGHMYTCGWFMLIYGNNQHNIVKKISCNKNF